jgi:FAD:protein FMN transferase
MSLVHRHAIALMDTVVTFEVVVRAPHGADAARVAAGVERAIEWFRRVERACSRFDPSSEVRALARQPGVAVRVSPLLFETVQFALAVAEASGGAFDPAVGADLEARGFDREYRSGDRQTSGIRPDPTASYRDLTLDPERRTIALGRPVLLDLGGVAKGLAVDLAARELAPFEHFAIDAGGDLFLAGRNADDEPWAIGIEHPRDRTRRLETLRVSNAAVCTSGDYARRTSHGHHLLDPRTRRPADRVASATVMAPTAMVADAFATAAFVLGPDDGVRFLERHGVDGWLVTPALERFATGSRAEIPSHA